MNHYPIQFFHELTIICDCIFFYHFYADKYITSNIFVLVILKGNYVGKIVVGKIVFIEFQDSFIPGKYKVYVALFLIFFPQYFSKPFFAFFYIFIVKTTLFIMKIDAQFLRYKRSILLLRHFRKNVLHLTVVSLKILPFREYSQYFQVLLDQVHSHNQILPPHPKLKCASLSY